MVLWIFILSIVSYSAHAVGSADGGAEGSPSAWVAELSGVFAQYAIARQVASAVATRPVATGLSLALSCSLVLSLARARALSPHQLFSCLPTPSVAVKLPLPPTQL